MTLALSDAHLVEIARHGDKTAFAELVGHHYPVLLGLCRRALEDPVLAEDAAQDAILQAMLSLDRLQQPERFGAWLIAIGLNICHQFMRRRRRDGWSLEAVHGAHVLDGLVETRPGPAELAEAAELRAQVRHLIARLPSGQRAAVLHFYLAGLTHAETAALLGISVGAVKTRLHKARQSLHRQLSGTYKEDTMDKRQEPAEARTSPETTTGEAAVEMRVRDVRRYRSPASGEFVHVALLESADDGGVLPIWMGEFEATALALSLEDVAPPRPMAYAFAAGLLGASGARLREVRITRLQHTTFYAEAVVEGSAGVATVDARPSDALNLALLTNAPIRVDARVLAAPVSEATWATDDAARAADVVSQATSTWSAPPPRPE